LRAIWFAISIALLLNFLALAGLVGWLYGTGRLDRGRVVRMVSMFQMTLDQQAQAEARAKEEAQAKAHAQAEAEHYRRVSAGPQSVNDRLALVQQAQDIAAERDNRQDDDLETVRRNLDQAWQALRQQRAAFDAERKAFDLQTEKIRKQRENEAFRQAVALYESLPPKQARDQFKQLITGGRIAQVVDYLSSMNKRKAVGVLSEFKDPADVPVATDLLERLRTRGEAVMVGEADDGTPAAQGDGS